VEKCPIVGVKVSDDGLKARLIVNNMRKSYIHTITIDGVREKEHFYSLVHPTAYYTLNNIPSGAKLVGSGISRRNSALVTASAAKAAPATAAKTTAGAKSTAKTAVTVSKAPTYEQVKPLLQKNTCLACHAPTTRVVGPAYSEIAKRNYSVAEILALIKNPKPEHWPDYSTPMPPMPQVSTADATKIAQWIRSLNK
jgi:cytochrome c551/c552